jgi:hypothetical protein
MPKGTSLATSGLVNYYNSAIRAATLRKFSASRRSVSLDWVGFCAHFVKSHFEQRLPKRRERQEFILDILCYLNSTTLHYFFRMMPKISPYGII